MTPLLLTGLITSSLAVVLWRREWWFAAVHVAVLILMWAGESVDKMAMLKIVALSLVIVVGLKQIRLENLGMIDRAWLIYVGWQFVALVIGATQGRAPFDLAKSAWFFLQPPLYWFLGRHLLTAPALRANFTILGVFAIVPALVMITSEGRGVVGASVIGGYLSHLVLPYWIARVYEPGHENAKQPFWIYLVIGVLLLDLLAGLGRRYWVPVVLSLLPFVNWTGIKRHARSLAGVGALLVLGLWVKRDLVIWALTKGTGWRDFESAHLLNQLQGVIDYVVGIGYGHSFSVIMPWGTPDVLGPGAHNFYAALLMNSGIFGLLALGFVVGAILTRLLRSKHLLARSYLFMFVGWLVSAWFDRPTDGLWVLGMLPAIAWLLAYERVPALRSQTATEDVRQDGPHPALHT